MKRILFDTARLGVMWVIVLLLLPSEATLAQTASQSPQQAYTAALELFESGLYEQAYEAFRQFEQDYPTHLSVPEANYYQAEALLAVGRTDEAAPLYASFADRFPNHPLGANARMTLGRYYYDKQDYERSRSAFGAVFQREYDPQMASEALYWMGMCSLSLKQADIGVDYLSQVVSRYPTSASAPKALYMIGKTQLEQNDYAGAATSFDQLAQRYPDSALTQRVALAQMEANFELGRYDRVIGEGERRLSKLQGRDEERALMLLGESANQLNDLARAQQYFGKLNRDYPKSPYTRYANFGMGWSYLQQQQYGQAAYFFGLAKGDLKDVFAHKSLYYQSVSKLLSKDLTGAQDGFNELAYGFPKGEYTDQALFELGLYQYQKQSWEDAARIFNQLITEHPNSTRVGDAWVYLGESFSMLGDRMRANNAFEQAFQSGSLSEDVRNHLNFRKGWLLYQSQNYAEAQQAFATAYQTTRSGDALFWQAEALIQAGKTNEAEQVLTQYLTDFKNDPNANNANYVLGWIYFNRKQYDKAAASFEKFLTSFRDTPEQQAYRTDAQMRLGDSYFALKRFDDATLAYRKVGNEGTVYALYQIGKSYMYNEQNTEAINAFRRLIGNYPTSEWAPESQYQIGYIFLDMNNYNQAIAEFSQVIRFYPNAPEAAQAQYGIGDAHFNQDRYNEAIVAYKEVLNKYPQSTVVADAIAGIQQSYLQLNQPGAADALIEQFLRNNNNPAINDEIRFKQAELQFQNGEYAKALTGFQYFLQTNKTPEMVPAASYYVGACFLQAKDITNAERFLRVVLERYPTDPAALEATRLMANLYLSTGRPTEALEAFKSFEAQSVDDPGGRAEALFGQAQALLALNRVDEGRAMLERLIAQYPNTDDALQAQLRLAALYQQQNKPAEALAIYRKIAGSGTNGFAAEAQFMYGSLLLQQGKAAEALQAFQTMPERYPDALDWLAQSYLGQARAYRALGQRQQAIQAYDKVITQFGETSFAATARTEKAGL